MKLFLTSSIIFFSLLSVHASEQEVTQMELKIEEPELVIDESVAEIQEPKFHVVPSARVLIDGALYASPQKQMFKDGMAIPEARLGVKMNYGKWNSWIDFGFAYGKIGLRNMWVEYSFNEHNVVRVGNFIQPFGLQSTSTMSVKSTFEAPLAAMPFTPGIQLGGMFTHVSPLFLSATSFHMESSALTNIMNYPLFNQQGYSIISRFVLRKPNSGKNGQPVLQVGISGSFSSPQRRIVGDEDIHDGFSLSANFPTRVTTLEAVGETVGNSMNSFKFSPEFIVAYKRFALEGAYYFQQVNRRQNLRHYQAQSGYVTFRTMLTGGDYGYSHELGDVVYPKKNALEFALDYNYATLSDAKAGIYGGRANSFNATLNYYFNPYITARLNYTYTHTWDHAGYIPMTLNGFQARIMVLF